MLRSNDHAPASVVDSGRAWVAALGVAVANGIAFGTAYTFGTFFDAMAEEFDADRSSTALIFALTLLLFFGFGIVSGPLSDRIGPIPLLFAGAVLFVVGLFLTSIVDRLWLGYLTYSIGVGLGGGCFVAPLTGTAGSLFVKWRGAALGLVATGNGLGTLFLIPFSESLISSQGWRTAYRGLAIVGLVGFTFALLTVIRQPARPSPAEGEAVSTSSTRGYFAEPVFRRLFASALLMSIGLFSAFAFIVPFATDNGVEPSTAALVMSVIGLASIIGRLALTSLAAPLGGVRLYQLMLVCQPVAYLVWLSAGGSVPTLIVFAVLLGTTYGGFVAISPEVAITLFGLADVGRLMGLLFLSFGIGGLIGPPVAGLIAESSGQSAVIVGIIVVVLAGLVASVGLGATSTPAQPNDAALDIGGSA